MNSKNVIRLRFLSALIAMVMLFSIMPISGIAAGDGVITFPDPNFEVVVREIIRKPTGDIFMWDVSGITVVEANERQISDLTGIEYFTALEDLHCSLNQITKLDVSKNTNLKLLSCSFNHITELDLSNNTKLEGFDCDLNRLNKLNITNCQLLTSISCSGNKIDELDLSNKPNLELVSCGYNKLQKLDLSNSPNLSIISFDANFIESIGDVIFHESANLIHFSYEPQWQDVFINPFGVSRTTKYFHDYELFGPIIFPMIKTYRWGTPGLSFVTPDFTEDDLLPGCTAIDFGESMAIAFYNAADSNYNEILKWYAEGMTADTVTKTYNLVMEPMIDCVDAYLKEDVAAEFKEHSNRHISGLAAAVDMMNINNYNVEYTSESFALFTEVRTEWVLDFWISLYWAEMNDYTANILLESHYEQIPGILKLLDRILHQDKDTGVVVNGEFEPGVVMEVTELNTGNFVLGPGNSVHAVYDIKFINDSAEVQPNGRVTVRLPIKDVSPTTSANWKVYYVERDANGNITNKVNMNAHVVQYDGVWYWEFETDHFSVYAVVDETSDPTEPTNPSNSFFDRLIAFFQSLINLLMKLFK